MIYDGRQKCAGTTGRVKQQDPRLIQHWESTIIRVPAIRPHSRVPTIRGHAIRPHSRVPTIRVPARGTPTIHGHDGSLRGMVGVPLAGTLGWGLGWGGA